MDRKSFLKNVCGLGLCGCAFPIFNDADRLVAGEGCAQTQAQDPRLAFARGQFAKMLGFMTSDVSPEICARILEKTGRECAKKTQLHVRFKGNPEGYMAVIKKNWGTESVWDKEKGVLTITVPEGNCGCPLVENGLTPSVWCNCALGYQKESFEAIFGKPVQASLKESKLSGSQRCVFVITLS